MKHAGSSRVRELVKKIENDPDRHALQQDLRQIKAHSLVRSQKDDSGSGNVELFELCETDSRRSAKHAYHTRVKASSIARAGIS